MTLPALRVAFRVSRPVRRVADPAAFQRSCRSISGQCLLRPATSGRAPRSTLSQQDSQRPFSSTTPSKTTVVLQNPRADEDGNDMTIEISERAAKRLKQITTSTPQRNTLAPSPSASDSHLRVTVTSGGCHGFQYLMSLEGASKIDEQEDTVFTADGSGGEGKAVVVMDEPSLELLKGSTVDFTTELIGSQFKIVGNPRAKSSCGCGTSFDVE